MDSLATKISEIIEELYGAKVPVEFATVPAEIEGDYSCNVAMRLAKQVGKAPREIAAEIIAKLPNDYEYSVAGPGFINVAVSGKALHTQSDRLEEVRVFKDRDNPFPFVEMPGMAGHINSYSFFFSNNMI